MSEAQPETVDTGTPALDDSAVIEEVVRQCAALSIIEYEKVRKPKAKELDL